MTSNVLVGSNDAFHGVCHAHLLEDVAALAHSATPAGAALDATLGDALASLVDYPHRPLRHAGGVGGEHVGIGSGAMRAHSPFSNCAHAACTEAAARAYAAEAEAEMSGAARRDVSKLATSSGSRRRVVQCLLPPAWEVGRVSVATAA